MKRFRVIAVAMSLLTVLFGCSGRNTAPWLSLTYHVTSSVQSEGCHFSLTREGLLTGYCFENGSEYRVEEAKEISGETLNAILAMELEQAASEKKRPSGMLDGTQISVTLGYEEGSMRRIALSPQQCSRLKELLQKELVGG